MLWVERDLSAVCKALFDNWDARKEELNHQYVFASSVRMSANELIAMIQKGMKRTAEALSDHTDIV
jgi:hypothetical protein